MRHKIVAASVCMVAKVVPRESPKKSDESDDRLIGVHVFFRHGARTAVFEVNCKPEVQYETRWDKRMIDDVPHTMIPFDLCDMEGKKLRKTIDNFRETTPSRRLPGGALNGELTQSGQREMFELGARIRRRYADKLPFGPSDLFCSSTRYPRTIASARCVLAGALNWTQESELQERPKIRIFELLQEETLRPNRHKCPWVQTALRDYVVREHVPGIIAMREKVAEMFGRESLIFQRKMKDGKTESTPSRLFGVRDYFFCQQYHNIPIPEQMPALLKEMDALCAYELTAATIGPQKAWKSIGLKAVLGPLYHQLLSEFSEMFSSDKRCQRLRLYSTHDNMLVPLLISFDCFDERWPKFGADLTIEIYEKKNKVHVARLYYCDKFIREMPLSDFRRILETFATSPDAHREVCSHNYYDYVKA